jgi:Holliday junction DNA helicase RuvA
MIASIEGRVAATYPDHVVIVTNGIGYNVYMPSSALTRTLENETLFVHTHLIVREDALTLYGFPTVAERELFEKIITVSGVGPKLALAIMGTLTPDHLRNAVVTEQPDILTRVPGIGKKMAQKIVFELKDKFKSDGALVTVSGFSDINADVLDTLVALGYSIVEAQSAIQSLPADAPQDVESRVRMALQYFV